MRLPKLGRWFDLTPRHTPPANCRGFRPRLEALDDRTLPSTFTVTTKLDAGAGSLRQAVLDANGKLGSDTIVFAKGVNGTITLTSGELLISGSVTINGPGAAQLSVSGNDSSRVFDMTSGLNVAINGLTITHGFALDQGGGILNQGSTLALSADVLSQNVVLGSSATDSARGGGLRSLDGDLTITGCTITSNQALGGTSSFGGLCEGGGIHIDAGTATISNSTFTGNIARGSNGLTGIAPGTAIGGAITSVTAPLTITGSTFRSNSAVGGNDGIGLFAGQGEGGAIASDALTITGSTFSRNSAIGGNGVTGGDGGSAF